MPNARAGYSGTPLPAKLGIRSGHRVLISGPPAGFALAPLPDEVRVATTPGRGAYDVIIAFCPDRATLRRRFRTAFARMPVDGAIWLAWPKKASGVETDLDEHAVRAHGLEAGLVDVKVCAVDATWSALRFVRRRADRAASPRARS